MSKMCGCNFFKIDCLRGSYKTGAPEIKSGGKCKNSKFGYKCLLEDRDKNAENTEENVENVCLRRKSIDIVAGSTYG
jgi:hypothetical protein